MAITLSGVDALQSRLRPHVAPTTRGCILIAVALFFCGWSVAATPSPLGVDGENRYLLSGSTLFFAGPDLEWQGVATNPVQESLPGGNYQSSLTELPVWTRVDLSIGDIPPARKWLYDSGAQFGGKITFYLIENGRLVDTQTVDSYQSFSTRPYNHRRLMFPIELKPNTDVQLLLKFEKIVAPVFNTSLYTEGLFIEADRRATWLSALQLGLIVAMMIYHLILAGATFDKVYLIYSLYIGANVFYDLVQQGFGFQYVWPNAPWVTAYWAPISGYLPTLFAIPFAVSFLHLRTLSKRLTHFFYAAFALVAFLVACRFAGYQGLAFTWTWFMAGIYAAFIGSAIYAMTRGVAYARFFLVAWTVFCLAMINLTLVNRGIGVFAAQSFDIMRFSFQAQVILLALALA
ncbi:MAG: 7TM diverse intracellular signaling domain-containing protein, partial [Cellvibrionaceae bacterium]